jgi:hypothetical protein
MNRIITSTAHIYEGSELFIFKGCNIAKGAELNKSNQYGWQNSCS